MQSNESSLTAAALVKRFKEGKPMSREEREQTRQSAGQNRMWWENDDPNISQPASQPVSRIKSTTEEQPRSSKREPMQPSSRARDLPPRLIESRDSFRPRALGNSMEVDNLIEQEIRKLQSDIKQKERETIQRLNQGSYSPLRSLNRSMENGITSPPIRYRPRDSTLGRASEQLSRSGDLFRASADSLTLGASALLGLNKADLKLDGKVDKEDVNNKDGKNKVSDDAKVEAMQQDLEELIKALQEGHDLAQNNGHPQPSSITEITNKLQCEMMEFQSLYNGIFLEDKRKEEEQKKRDQEMIEEGRKLEREKRLLDIDPPVSHPLEHLSAWADMAAEHEFKDNMTQAQSSSRYVRFSDIHNAPSYYNNVRDVDGVGIHHTATAAAHGLPPSQYDRDTILMQQAIDNELHNADEVHRHMRQLRTNLGTRFRQMDAMYDSVMPPSRTLDPFGMRSDPLSQPRSGARGITFQPSQPTLQPHNVGDLLHGRARPIAPPSSHFWGLEEQLEQQQHDERYPHQHRDDDTRKIWNPYPDLLCENVFAASKGIASVLDSAMDTLNKRLPEKKHTALAHELTHPHHHDSGSSAAGSRAPTPTTPRVPADTTAEEKKSAAVSALSSPRSDGLSPPPIKADMHSSVEKLVDNIMTAAKDKASHAHDADSKIVAPIAVKPKDADTSGHSLSLSADSVAGDKLLASGASIAASKDSAPISVSSSTASVRPAVTLGSSGGSLLSRLRGGSVVATDPVKDLEYIDSVLEKGERASATSRFDKFMPHHGGDNPFSPPAAAGSKTVSFAAGSGSSSVRDSKEKDDKEHHPADASHAVDLDPLRELRQHRVYQNVLYRRGGSLLHPYNDPVRVPLRDMSIEHHYDQFAPSAPPSSTSFAIQPPPLSIYQQQSQMASAPMINSSTRPQSIEEALRVAQSGPLRRPVEGAAMTYRKEQLQHHRAPKLIEGAVYAPPQQPAMSRMVPRMEPSMPSISATSSAIKTMQVPSFDAPAREREAYLNQMRALRQNMLKS